ncbi:MAG: helix-turn-helix domain-containing protein [Thermoleophilaceae bacterium]
MLYGPPGTGKTHEAKDLARRLLRHQALLRWGPVAYFENLGRIEQIELVRRFGAQVGLTPHAFQTNLRIARARDLLATGTTPAAVAAACGFADQPHLTRTFRVAVGVTPARYARAVRG